MASYLLILAGDRARQHPIRGDALTIGSSRGCDLVLDAPGVAPRHAKIRREGERLLIEPLEGALVRDGRQLAAHELRTGEEVVIGQTRLRLIQDSADPRVRLSKTAAEISFDSLSQADPRRAVRYQRRFQLLMELARTTGSETGYEGLLDRLMGLVLRGLKPERAVLAVLEQDGDDPEGVGQIRFEAARHARSKDPWHDLQVSGTILRQVFSTGTAFIAADASSAGPLAGAPSIATQGIRSAICVPFRWPGRLPGALYADLRGDAHFFDEDDLDFLLMLSQLAAVALQNVRDFELVTEEVRELRTALQEPGALVGDSPVIQRVRELVSKVAASDQPVLILGERGTGKELVARSIHDASGRSPFVAVNCAAIPESLTESAFFGHEKGAFTGADRPHRGYFEQARGGTLFLDEIGDLRLPAQAAILRALQEGEIRRVGSLEPLAVEVRIIAATNRDLDTDAARESFRADLFDRLDVLRITVPPLRERIDDVHKLATHFARDRVSRISAKSLRLLRDYAWPGNVRELRNVIERAIVMGDGETIWPEDLPQALREGQSGHYHLASLEAVERDHITRVLRHTKGNVSRAAKILGIGRVTLHKRLKSFKLAAADFKD